MLLLAVFSGILLHFYLVTGLVVAARSGALQNGGPAIRALGASPTDAIVNLLLFCVLSWLWFTVGESSVWQATVGKRLVNVQVTDKHGNRIGFGRANVRFWSKIISSLFCGPGFIVVGISRTKQGLHDRIAATLVVKDENIRCPQCGTNNVQESKSCGECGSLLVATTEPGVQKEASSLARGPKYAGFWIRTLAVVIDCVLLLAACFFIVACFFIPTALLVAVIWGSHATGGHPIWTERASHVVVNVGLLLCLVVSWLWFTVAESSIWQATFGKRLLGLKVTDENGARIGFGRANRRFFAKILSSIGSGAGFVMAVFTVKRQGLHDKIAHTLVVKADT